MEREFHRWLSERFPAPSHVALGVGDDAALLNASPGKQIVAAADMLVEGAHFKLAETSPAKIGRKALAANLSDLAAMGAKPTAALVCISLPRKGALQLARELLEGMAPLAERYDVAIVGGDTTVWEGPLTIGVTLLGEATPGETMLRSAAKPGDALLVTGELGGSLAGRHFDFEPRLEAGLLLAQQYGVRAAIDISDGLSLDLHRLLETSGCGAEIEAARVPVSAAAVELSRQSDDDLSSLDHALSDGEDFELLIAAPPDVADRLIAEQPLDVKLTRIGRCTSERDVWLIDESGQRANLPARGYVHGETP